MLISWKTIFKWSVLLCVVMSQPLFFWSGPSVLNLISHKWIRFYTKQICLKLLIAPHTYDHTESRYIGTGLPKTMSFYIKGTFALAMAVARLPIDNIYYIVLQLNQPRQYIEWKANICNYSLPSSVGFFLPLYKWTMCELGDLVGNSLKMNCHLIFAREENQVSVMVVPQLQLLSSWFSSLDRTR